MDLHVQQIKQEEARPWILTKHYAHRMPPVSYAFGLYDGIELVGVCAFGTPPAPSLRNGICGKEYSQFVSELKRVCLRDNKKNEASMLIGRSLKLMPKPSVLVSYSDTSRNHVGYIYQATNWYYTGLSMKNTDYEVVGMEHLHNVTISDMARGKDDRVSYLKELFGDKLSAKDRARKHRYVYFVGSKTQKKQMRKALKYPVLPYPKGESKRYDSGGAVPTQKLLFR